VHLIHGIGLSHTLLFSYFEPTLYIGRNALNCVRQTAKDGIGVYGMCADSSIIDYRIEWEWHHARVYPEYLHYPTYCLPPPSPLQLHQIALDVVYHLRIVFTECRPRALPQPISRSSGLLLIFRAVVKTTVTGYGTCLALGASAFT
jgi:hypothetical protein